MSKKGGTTYESRPDPPTAQELRLQDVQANFAERTAPTALQLQQTGANMLFNNPGIVPVDYTTMGNQAVQGAQALQGQASTLGNNIGALSNYNQDFLNQGTSRYNDLTNTNNANQTAGTTAYNGLINNQNNLNQSNAQSMTGLMNGELPQAYAQNMQYAINRGAQTAIGDLLAQKMKNGVISSSSFEAGRQGVSDSVANALSSNYLNSMNQAAGMQNQNATQQQNGQNYLLSANDNLNQLRQQGFTNQAGVTEGINNLNQQSLANQQNLYNAQSQNIEQQRGLLSQPMELINSAQNASIDIPNKLLGMSQGQQANTSNLWQNMAQQRIAARPDVAVVPGNGGLFGGITSGLGSYLGARR